MPILRISRGKIRPGTWEQFEATYLKAVHDAGNVPGLLARSLSRNSSDPDEGFSLSLWEDEASVIAYEKSALAKTVNPLLQQFFTGDYRFDHSEVRHWETLTKPSSLQSYS